MRNNELINWIIRVLAGRWRDAEFGTEYTFTIAGSVAVSSSTESQSIGNYSVELIANVLTLSISGINPAFARLANEAHEFEIVEQFGAGLVLRSSIGQVELLPVF